MSGDGSVDECGDLARTLNERVVMSLHVSLFALVEQAHDGREARIVAGDPRGQFGQAAEPFEPAVRACEHRERGGPGAIVAVRVDGPGSEATAGLIDSFDGGDLGNGDCDPGIELDAAVCARVEDLDDPAVLQSVFGVSIDYGPSDLKPDALIRPRSRGSRVERDGWWKRLRRHGRPLYING